MTDIVSLYASAEDYDVSLSSDSTTRIFKMDEGDLYVQMTWDTTDDLDIMLNAAPAIIVLLFEPDTETSYPA